MVSLLILGLLWLGASEESRRHLAVDDNGEARSDWEEGDPFPWQEEGPLEFLDHLRALHQEGQLVYGVDRTHVGWVQERDIPALLAELDSQEPCAGVSKANNSRMIELQPSTVGREAAFLIKAFRAERDPPVTSIHYKGYPPLLFSTIWTFDPDPDEIRAWWAAYLASRADDASQTGAHHF